MADNGVRSRRIMKELQEAELSQAKYQGNPVFTVDLVNDNLFEWHVRLHRIDPDSLLARDMHEAGVPYILLHIVFPDNFPFHPPFVRVVSPHIVKGFVMEGGAICMELLTPHGWTSGYTVEAIIMQFAASVVKGEGRIAKKQEAKKAFTKELAEKSFRSIVEIHKKSGWYTPPPEEG